MTFDKDDKISSDSQKAIDDEIRRLLKVRLVIIDTKVKFIINVMWQGKKF